ncbi:DeoR/GlpR family DNA-binding transcription regulator [Chitinophaga pinensis]|uniref:Transcriptional regulator, DeoR family n=1 Tax=Chitinophaga pinensis (strain ATCC 43595 / DSM 2588 / LMG 13176 / NBRC 15968 / NCIMB 11800 / UQM 2034) TaxID=485918 RepID=A0A979GS37_CHIPD|nr:DeoR family transcriptional regulator [Chitinophaga pinensis]ACU62782.1 transcriptional regulator, DeoR family [Chitinophaga pinensis DSM 2588]
MNKEERHQLIINKLRLLDKVDYESLSNEFSVSSDTIRRDINELAEAGMIRKIKGGAQPQALIPVSYEERERYGNAGKRIVAQKAAALIKDGQVVVFDGGTTPFLIAGNLPRNIQLTVITHSFPIASLLLEYPNVELIFAGGRASRKSKITTGFEVLHKYNHIHADIGILGIHSLHHEAGVTDPVYEEVEVKARIAAMSDQLIVVPTAEKLYAVSNYTICRPDAIHTLVTDLQPDDPVLQPYQQLGIQLR